MQLRNGPHGYGVVTKLLHWATVGLVVAQLTVGYLMDDEGGGHGRGRGRGRGGSGHGRGGDDLAELDLLPVHITLGVLIVAVVLVRVGWRRRGLPPWDPRLTTRQQIVAKRTEEVLLGALVLVPVTGLALVLSGDDDLVWLHVAGHVVLFAALAAHLALVLGKRLLPRML